MMPILDSCDGTALQTVLKETIYLPKLLSVETTGTVQSKDTAWRQYDDEVQTTKKLSSNKNASARVHCHLSSAKKTRSLK